MTGIGQRDLKAAIKQHIGESELQKEQSSLSGQIEDVRGTSEYSKLNGIQFMSYKSQRSLVYLKIENYKPSVQTELKEKRKSVCMAMRSI